MRPWAAMRSVGSGVGVFIHPAGGCGWGGGGGPPPAAHSLGAYVPPEE
jgi:hypothetical protein